ncbi:MAG: YdgA family protein [Halothiobacillaceae bacterium]|nr:YdgA family protein [Halothiobacillaceae bacterium]
MKKTAIALVLAVPVIAYPAASWVIGGQADALLVEQYAQLDDNEIIKIVERKMQRGIFSSEEVVTFEFQPEFIEQLRALSKNEDVQAPIEPVRFSFRTRINHGPLPELSSVGLATAHTELELNHPLVTTLYAGKSPLTSDTTIDFSGKTHDRIRSPAVSSVVDGSTSSWGEFVLDVTYDRSMTEWTYQGGLPYIKLGTEDGSHSLELNGLALEGQQSRVFADNPYLYTGPVKFTLQSMETKGAGEEQPPMRMKNMLIQSNVTEKTGFIDILVGYSIESIQLGEEAYRAARFDLALRHLQAKALAELNLAAQGVDSEGELSMEQFKPLLRPLQVLLENSPEIVIEHMGVTTPEGEIKASAMIKLPNANVGNLEAAVENPLMLMGLASVLEASTQLAVPQALLMASLSEEQAEMLPPLIQAGYVLDKNGQLSTSISYAQGKTTINGQPLDPSLLMQGKGDAD